jgi:hypothetical protein
VIVSPSDWSSAENLRLQDLEFFNSIGRLPPVMRLFVQLCDWLLVGPNQPAECAWRRHRRLSTGNRLLGKSEES